MEVALYAGCGPNYGQVTSATKGIILVVRRGMIGVELVADNLIARPLTMVVNQNLYNGFLAPVSFILQREFVLWCCMLLVV